MPNPDNPAPAFARMRNGLGVALYTLRGILPRDPLAALQAVERMGYREAEAAGFDENLDAVLAALAKTALKPVSLHLHPAMWFQQRNQLDATLADAARRGFQYVVCPYVFPDDRGSLNDGKLAEALNSSGRLCRELGMRMCYHNHAFDFGPAGAGTFLDSLLSTTDPDLGGLEFDVMWAKLAGFDPAQLLEKYSSRIELLHLKNLAPDVAQSFDENMPPAIFREVGNGVVNIPAVLAAAERAGVKHYFVEQDFTPGDPLDSVRASYDYLETLT